MSPPPVNISDAQSLLVEQGGEVRGQSPRGVGFVIVDQLSSLVDLHPGREGGREGGRGGEREGGEGRE